MSRKYKLLQKYFSDGREMWCKHKLWQRLFQANERCAANVNCDKILFRRTDGDELRVMRTSGRPSDTSHSNRKTALTTTYLSGICQKFSQCSIAPFRSVINISQGPASWGKVFKSANHIYRLRQHFFRWSITSSYLRWQPPSSHHQQQKNMLETSWVS